jgi:hypothetical protein
LEPGWPGLPTRPGTRAVLMILGDQIVVPLAP